MDQFTIFAKNFRGFRSVQVEGNRVNFLVGDNSSGKTSILHLIGMVLNSELSSIPRLDEDLSVAPYDYFSPYIGFENVEIGYIASTDQINIAKVVTLRQQKKSSIPKLIRSTLETGGVSLSIKKSQTRTSARISENSNLCVTVEGAIQLHQSKTGFKKLNNFPSDIGINHPAAVTITVGNERLSDRQGLVKALFGDHLPSARHLAPVRGMPEKYYAYERKIRVSGSHFASMWRDLDRRSPKALEIVNAFGKESGLYDKIEVKPIASKDPDSPLLVHVWRNGKELSLNQVGVGVAQVIPILVEFVYALMNNAKQIMLVQQPELHLHPIAQAAMGEVLYRFAELGLTFSIETHSNYLIDRFRALQNERDKSNSPVSARILFCSSSKEGNSVQPIEIDEAGHLIDPPESYHSFFVDELIRTTF